MTTRERFVRTLTGQDVDRVPFMKVFGGDNAIARHWENERPGIRECIDELLRFEGPYRGWQRSSHASIELINVGEPEVLSDDGETAVLRYATGQVEMRRRADFSGHPLEFAVKTAGDWDRIRQRHLPSPEACATMPDGWTEAAEAFNVRDYPLQLSHGGAYGFIRKLMGDEALAYAFYDQPEMVKDIIDTYTDACITRWGRAVEDVTFDLIEMWEDMASKNGCLISPATFEQFIAPAYRRIRAFADAHGIRILLVDSDGYIEQLTPLMLAAGATAMYPYEVQAGNDALATLARLPTLGAIGCLDKNCMASGREAIDEEMERARALIRQGRCIPGPDHFVLSDVSFEHYEYFMRSLRDVVLATRPGS